MLSNHDVNRRSLSSGYFCDKSFYTIYIKMSTSPVASPSVIKKHKKHKSEKREKQEEKSSSSTGLKLILKVGSQTTPEHVSEYGGPPNLTNFVGGSGETTMEGDHQMQIDPNNPHFCMGISRSHHKKSKKKKKKKDKNKDREKKHKHHHKDKKRKREDNDETGK